MNSRTLLKALKIFTTSAIVFSVDRISKYLAYIYLQNGAVFLVDPFFSLRYVENKGFLFGIGSEAPVWLTIGLGVLGILGLILLFKGINTIWIGLLVGGGISNLVDRIINGKVIDFIDIKISDSLQWPVFNLADCFIVVGLIGALLSVRQCKHT